MRFQQGLETGSEDLTQLLTKVWVLLDDGVRDIDIDTVVAIQHKVDALKELLDEIERVFPAPTPQHLDASTL